MNRKFDFECTDCREKALQRALLKLGSSKITPSTIVEWLDIELPVDHEKEKNINGRGPSVDLIGITNKGQFVLVELKFDNTTDSPQDAENELLGYVNNIRRNAHNLEINNMHHSNGKYFNWEDVFKKKPILIVAANAGYWAHWLGHRNYSVPKNVKCYSLDIPANYFKLQKPKDQKKYIPSIEIEGWKIL